MGATNTLDVTGNLTGAVSGNMSDSADGTYHIGATGNTDIQTSGTFNTKSGAQTHIKQGFFVDGTGDVILDAAGGQIDFKTDQIYVSGTDAGANNEIDETGNLKYDVSGTVTLDAAGSKFVLIGGGANDSAELKFNNGNQLELETPAGLYLDVEGDLTLDANGNDVFAEALTLSGVR